MSESVACALEFMDNDNTQQTLLFIKMVDRFFDYLNVKSPLMAQWKRKESIAPYKSPLDPRFKVSWCYTLYMHNVMKHAWCFSVVAIRRFFDVPERMGGGSRECSRQGKGETENLSKQRDIAGSANHRYEINVCTCTYMDIRWWVRVYLYLQCSHSLNWPQNYSISPMSSTCWVRCFRRTRWRDISPSSDTVEEATRTPQQSRYH